MKHRAEWTEHVARRKKASPAGVVSREATTGTPPPARHLRAGAPSKYRSEKTNGYGSKKEAKRGAELDLMEAAGSIGSLRKQVRYTLFPAQRDADGRCVERSWVYVADFVYWDHELKAEVVEDTKGVRTPEYVAKRKAMLYLHKIRILET
jgi:hypothetical protein